MIEKAVPPNAVPNVEEQDLDMTQNVSEIMIKYKYRRLPFGKMHKLSQISHFFFQTWAPLP